MAMKLVKKTDEYSIFQRSDERYAVKDAKKNPINGDDKVRILVEEGLVKAPLPAKEAVEEEARAEEGGEAEEAEAAVEAAADDAPEEPASEDAPAEEAADEEGEDK